MTLMILFCIMVGVLRPYLLVDPKSSCLCICLSQCSHCLLSLSFMMFILFVFVLYCGSEGASLTMTQPSVASGAWGRNASLTIYRHTRVLCVRLPPSWSSMSLLPKVVKHVFVLFVFISTFVFYPCFLFYPSPVIDIRNNQVGSWSLLTWLFAWLWWFCFVSW